MTPPDDHDRGLAQDLAALDALIGRRRALGWIAGAGALALVPGSSPSQPRTTGSAVCLAFPTETAGPFPGNGTNRASGPTSNALATRGVVRSDIRRSFIGSDREAAGVPLDVTLTILDATGCAPLAGHAVYVWQSDAAGLYSLYSAPSESYLRGVQLTDAAGRVRFTTIVPGCYAGRYPHIHVQVYPRLDAAMTGGDALLTSQLVIPEAVSNAVYAGAGYPGSAESFRGFSLARDVVFRDNSAAQLAAMTLAATGDARRGYVARASVAVA